MNFTVIWTQTAESRLADLWLNARDRAAVTVAARHLDKLLEDHPLDVGESRSGQVRVAFDYPLGIEFEVDADTREVFVLSVWSFEKNTDFPE